MKLDENYLKNLVVKKGLTQPQIADRYGRSRSWLTKKCKECGINPHEHRKDKTITKRLILDLIERGYSREQIIEFFGVKKTLMSKRFKEYGITMWFTKKVNHPIIENKDELYNRYVEKEMTISDIAEEVGCSSPTVINAMEKFKIEKRKPSISGIDMDEAIRLNQEEWWAVSDIAEKFNVPTPTLREKLKRNGVNVNRADSKADYAKLNNKNWMHQKHWKDKLSCRQIAEITNSSTSVVNKKLNSLGIGAQDPKVLEDERVYSYDWLYQKHINEKMTGKEIAEIFDCSTGVVNRQLIKLGIENQSYRYIDQVSNAERELADYIEQSTKYEVIRSDRSIISPFELDIVIPEKKIAIEYCGLYWHSEQMKSDNKYHRKKLDMCKKQGYRLITIFEDEWVNSEDIVKNKLLNILGYREQSVMARKTKVVFPDSKQAKQFFNETHIQGGNSKFTHTIGLEKDDELVAVMTFIKRKEDEVELNRFASSVNVVGGFTKLLKNAIKVFDLKDMYSFGDLRWVDVDNNVYIKNGFDLEYVTNPDYRYTKGNDLCRSHKFNFRKKRLKSILGEAYDDFKTEHQLCNENGYYRIYDCGLAKFRYQN